MKDLNADLLNLLFFLAGSTTVFPCWVVAKVINSEADELVSYCNCVLLMAGCISTGS